MSGFLRRLELLLRFGFTYPLFRLLFRNPVREKPVDLQSIGKILILRYDRIGDIIVTTPVLSALKTAAPHVKIGVLASPSNSDLIRYDPNVDAIYILHSNWYRLLREVLKARRDRYDVVLNFIFNRTTSGGILANLLAPNGIKIGQGAELYRFYFNMLLRIERGSKHMVDVLFDFVEQAFGIELNRASARLSIALHENDRKSVNEFLRENGLHPRNERGEGRKFAVVNISAAENHRKISTEQARGIIAAIRRVLDTPVVVISSPADNNVKSTLIRHLDSADVHAFPKGGVAGMREIAALIESALIVVTPDTSIIHVAAAMNTPLIALFSPLQALEWLPYRVKHWAILTETGKDVQSIPVDRVEEALREFSREFQQQ